MQQQLQTIEFTKFPKIPRLNRLMVITEKIDGTNASIFIPENPNEPILAGKRTGWCGLGKEDNFGFNNFVQGHADAFRKFKPGHYFGEWYGVGIQRGYNMTERKFALFNPKVEIPEELRHIVHHTTVLAQGPFNTDAIETALELLRQSGSLTVPGFMKPEGIVVYHVAANCMFKVMLENDDAPKSKMVPIEH